LLLDEPAAGIDFHDQEKFYNLIGRINRERRPRWCWSRTMSAWSATAPITSFAEDGSIQCQGPPSQVLSKEVLARTFGASSRVPPQAIRPF